jgi:hypothetical protein
VPGGQLPGHDASVLKELLVSAAGGALAAGAATASVGALALAGARFLLRAAPALVTLVRGALRAVGVRLNAVTAGTRMVFLRCLAAEAGAVIVDAASHYSEGSGILDIAETVSFYAQLGFTVVSCGRLAFRA